MNEMLPVTVFTGLCKVLERNNGDKVLVGQGEMDGLQHKMFELNEFHKGLKDVVILPPCTKGVDMRITFGGVIESDSLTAKEVSRIIHEALEENGITGLCQFDYTGEEV